MRRIVCMNGTSTEEKRFLLRMIPRCRRAFLHLGKLLGLSNDDAKDILLDPWDRSHGNGKWNQKSASLHLYCPYRWCLKIPFWVVALGPVELGARSVYIRESWVIQRAKHGLKAPKSPGRRRVRIVTQRHWLPLDQGLSVCEQSTQRVTL